MATATLIVLPVVIFSLLVSRHLVKGLTMGAIKQLPCSPTGQRRRENEGPAFNTLPSPN